MVGVALFTVILGTLLYGMAGARRMERASSRWISLAENACRALHTIRQDFRQAVVVPGFPIETHSARVAPDGRSVVLRRIRTAAAAEPAVYESVDYDLVPTVPQTGRFHLRRNVAELGGTPGPGNLAPRAITIFRSFALVNLTFALGPAASGPAGTVSRPLDATLLVASEEDPPARDQAGQSLRLMCRTLLTRPELPFDLSTGFLFAQPLPFAAELPPGLQAVVAPTDPGAAAELAVAATALDALAPTLRR